MFRHSAKICGSGRTWSSRSCQNRYGPGRGTALKAWVICSTCPRSTSKTGPQRWATDQECCNLVAERILCLLSSLLLLNFFFNIYTVFKNEAYKTHCPHPGLPNPGGKTESNNQQHQPEQKPVNLVHIFTYTVYQGQDTQTVFTLKYDPWGP